MMGIAALRRVTGARPRLVLSLAIAAVAWALLPESWSQAVRVITAWDIGIGCYLTLAFHMIAKSSVDHMRQRASAQDENAWVILLLMSAAALFSVLAIVLVLRATKGLPALEVGLHLGLAGTTIVGAWLFAHVMFALHYAHGFYQTGADGAAGGLDFPGAAEPDYWDFCYFSFVIGMTCQVSDVPVTARALRRLVLAHGVFAFFFNTIILALSINIAAGLI